jgi:hypothetical protein
MKSFRMMKTLDIADAKGSLASHARKLRGRPVILTQKGKPLMVLLPRRLVGTKRKSQRRVG